MAAGPGPAGGKAPGMRLLYLTEIDEADELEHVWAIDFRELEQVALRPERGYTWT